jgi:hypothetical protein
LIYIKSSLNDPDLHLKRKEKQNIRTDIIKDVDYPSSVACTCMSQKWLEKNAQKTIKLISEVIIMKYIQL